MRSIRALIALGLVAGLLATTAASAAAMGGRMLSTSMSGAEEAPGPGDPDGEGWASFTVNPGRGQICYALEVSGIDPATASHIHLAPAGSPGPVVVPLTPPTSGSSSGCAEVSRELALAIIHDPTAYYVNVHNAAYPAGAVRGQLGD